MVAESNVGAGRRSALGRFVPLVLIAGALGLFFLLGLDDYLSFATLKQHRETLKEVVAANRVAAAVAFIAFYALATAVSLPGGAVLTLAGGFLFGTLLGGAYVVVGATLGATALFLAARTAVGDFLRARAGPRMRRMEEGFRENALSYLLFLRLMPLFPFWLVNLVPALLGVRLSTFVVGTFIGIIPGSLVYASVGNGLGAVFDAGRTPNLDIVFRPEVLLPLLALAALSLVPIAYKRFRGGGGRAGALALHEAPAIRDIRTDLCVIGAGSGGLSVAAGAAQMGARVVLVEKGRMGGDCLNYGCVPSKSLLAAARIAAEMRGAGPFGIAAAEPVIDFAAVNRHVHDVIAAIAPHDSEERFEGLGVTVIKAHAEFVSPREVLAGDARIRARRFVIATGSSAFVPPIPGIGNVPFLTNETIFELKSAPEHLLVIGGGPIGAEMAQAHRRLGCKVTLIEGLTLLNKDDPELVEVVRRKLIAEGVTVMENAKVAAMGMVGDTAGAVRLVVEGADGQREVDGSHLLVAVGRAPNAEGLGLEEAGIAHTKKGIAVDRHLRTTNRRVFAIGDVAGGYQFTHVAGYHAGIVIRNALFRLSARADRAAVPWVTYTDPELAHVGLTEAEARRQRREHTVLRTRFRDNDRARTERRPEGLVKVVAGKKGRVLGASIVGAHAGELILPWVLAVEGKLGLKDMASVIVPYPTLSEAGKWAAGSWYTTRLFSERTKRLVRFLARLP